MVCHASVRFREFVLSKTEEIRLVDGTTPSPIKNRDRSGSAIEVLLAFAKLGVSCFGGPIAHIGYFRQEFVVRRGWLGEASHAGIVGLFPFLAGPANSPGRVSLGFILGGFFRGPAALPTF